MNTDTQTRYLIEDVTASLSQGHASRLDNRPYGATIESAVDRNYPAARLMLDELGWRVANELWMYGRDKTARALYAQQSA